MRKEAKSRPHALRSFDLRVDRGECVAVTGPSGAGRTKSQDDG